MKAKYKIPNPGTKTWQKEMAKALKNPNFKIKVNKEACKKQVEAASRSELHWANRSKSNKRLYTTSQAKDLNEAKQFLLEHVKDEDKMERKDEQ